jgi:multimeric flavodoxin WrbA
MKIIGFSAGSTGKTGNVDRMIQAVMSQSGWESEFVKLTDLNFTGCKGCVELCAKPQVCRAEDDLLPYYQKIKEADAVVLGTPVYFGSISGTIRAFIERFYGYRHVTYAIAQKPFVLMISGCAPEGSAPEDFENALQPFDVNVLETLYFCSLTPPCLSCGCHETCCIGGLYHMFGKEAHSLEITPDMFKRWEDDPITVAAIEKVSAKVRALKK